jgi:chitinase
MLLGLLSLLLIKCCSGYAGTFPAPQHGVYFPNWAQYRPSPATFTAQTAAPIMNTINVLYYGFAYFCPNSSMVQPYWVDQLNLCKGKQPFDVISLEPKDPQFYKTFVGYKRQNKDLKLIISIGGWNFPSNFWSQMVSDKGSRSKFIESCKSFMKQNGFDGVDLDWEFPNSEPRINPVKITCEKFYYTTDEGGSPKDGENLLSLVKEMHESYGSEYIVTIASQADPDKAADENIGALWPYIDMYNLMSYDYTVSDILESPITAPNEPLYPPPKETGIWNDSVSVTIDCYLKHGVPPSKISVGIAYYGHLWYTPGLTSQNDWAKFGVPAKVQGECCGPFKETYGAKYGKYSQLCGTYMYSEIKDAGFEVVFDNTTNSDIGYAKNPKDSYTANGVWISYQDTDTIQRILDFSAQRKVGGAFGFDISMDSMSGRTFTFELTHQISTYKPN